MAGILTVSFFLVLGACSEEKFPALAKCEQLKKAGVALKQGLYGSDACSSSANPTAVAYATDAARFWLAEGRGPSTILMFKDDADYGSALTLYTGARAAVLGEYKLQTFPKKRMLVLLDGKATSEDIAKTQAAF